jgi:hypothetical protein
MAGYSIQIFELTARDLEHALVSADDTLHPPAAK